MPRFGVGIGLFALALGLRAAPWPTVLTPERVSFFGYDAYYHMRRVAYTLAHFPQTLEFDRYVAFPAGGRTIWPASFDALLAFLLWPIYQLGGLAAAERAAVWLPPLLGAATVVVVYVLARRIFDARVAAAAGLALCVLSGHFWYSQVGFIDHHAAVALMSTLLLAAVLALLRRLSSGAPFASAGIVAGASAALSLLLWPGCLLFVAIVETALLAFAATRPTRLEARRSAGALCLANATALLVVWPGIPASPWPQWSAYSPVVLSHFQPWLFAAGALLGGAAVLRWGRPGAADRASRRRVEGFGIGAVILAASLLALPELRGALGDAWSWLARDEAFQAQVGESQPLFVVAGHIGGYIAELRLSRFVYALPLALAAMAFQERKRPDRAQVWLVVGWSLALFAVTLAQRRFFNSGAVGVALAMGWTVVRMLAAAQRRWPGAMRRRTIAVSATLALAWLVAPTLAAYRGPFENLARMARGDGLLPDPMGPSKLRILQVAEWLRDYTPETAGYFDARATPEYGVLCDWVFGHVVQYVARRPAVVDNFGDDVGGGNFALAADYFAAGREAEASRILDRLRVRYIVVKPAGGSPESVRERLYATDGSGFARHRLLYETPRSSRGVDPTPLKVFEHVPGAVLVGRAPPGSRVRARLRYTLGSGRRPRFDAEALADASGVYRLRLPHATLDPPPGLQTDPAYRIVGTATEVSVRVSERDVQQGRELRGPDFPL